MKKTKIVASLGPSSNSFEKILERFSMEEMEPVKRKNPTKVNNKL